MRESQRAFVVDLADIFSLRVQHGHASRGRLLGIHHQVAQREDEQVIDVGFFWIAWDREKKLYLHAEKREICCYTIGRKWNPCALV